MPSDSSDGFLVLEPSLQISFYYKLQKLKALYLSDGLKETVAKVDLEVLDEELRRYVGHDYLRRVASFGIRGEVFFPVPYLLRENPFLLGYYRLLFGLSQKEFYSKGPFGRFKRMEERREILPSVEPALLDLCASLTRTGERLVHSLDELSLNQVHELQILTLGPQLRGSENTRKGTAATRQVYTIIESIVGDYATEKTDRLIVLENDSHRIVFIEFFSDPDVQVTEKLETTTRPLVSMEIKGGTDASNIHNRIGEAEKSHQKSKNRGFFEFWTILRVEVDLGKSKAESPTTSHFFHLDNLNDPGHAESKKFKQLLGSIMGIKS